MKVGVQLYSVRGEMEQNVPKTLEAVKKAGYDYVEFAGYFGYSAGELKKILNDCGLTAVSAHQALDTFATEADYDFVAELGLRYVAVPWTDKQNFREADRYAALKADITSAAARLRSRGITLLYHNHDFEFETDGGQFFLDRLYADLPAEDLQTELDSCWVHYAGQDPAAYVAKYAGRCPVVHLKDYTAPTRGGEPVYALIDGKGKTIGAHSAGEFRFRPLGEGRVPFGPVIDTCKASGAQYVIVEQDQTYEDRALDAVARSRAYLKGLGL